MKEEPRMSVGSEYYDTDSNAEEETVHEDNKSNKDQNQKIKKFKKVGDLTACLSPVEIYFTLFKGLVGIGILYLPKGFTYSGWLFSIIALLISGLFTLEGLNRQILAHKRVGGGYPGLVEKAYGLPLRICIEICIVTVQVYIFNI